MEKQSTQKKFNISFFNRLFGRGEDVALRSSHRGIGTKISQETRVEILKALADETRLSIVQKLIREHGVVASCDILACASVHKLSQPAMSHHFGKLVDAGVIKESKQGTQKLYELDYVLLASAGIDITNI